MNNPTFCKINITPLTELTPKKIEEEAIECRLANLATEYLYTQELRLLRTVASNFHDATALRQLNASLTSSNAELVRFQNVTIDRELRMIALKKENEELKTKLKTNK